MRARSAFALALVTLLLAALPAAAAAKTVVIHAGTNADGSMYLKPKDVNVDKGDVVTLQIVNDDTIFHDVALLDYEGKDIETEVPGKTTQQSTFTASKAGDFRLICEVAGHKQKGMEGTLHVKGNALPGFELPAAFLALGLAVLTLRRRGPGIIP